MFKKMINPVFVLRSVIVFLAFTAAGDIVAEPLLPGSAWHWTSLQKNEPASQTVIPMPENYTLTFNDKDNLQIKADCNMVRGGYTLEGGKMSIMLGPSTRAACGDQSLDRLFIGMLERIDYYRIENDQLMLTLQEQRGVMTFNRYMPER